MTRSPSIAVSVVQVESVKLPPYVKPPGSAKALFLAGAALRDVEIEGKLIKVTAIGIYLKDAALPLLAAKWSGKSTETLAESVEFFRDIITAPFEKFWWVSMILPLTGPQYTEKGAGNCVQDWHFYGGTYTDADATAVEKFREAFKDQSFRPGASILYAQTPNGPLTTTFSEDGSIPEAPNAVIENRQLGGVVLGTLIGEQGVCPQARMSVAARICALLEDGKMKARQAD
ncbi:chalcone--flavanone isomerase-like [Syzygium oleosum]|uniref:chalcone--flavanone isomerase-like n=1 Tax=Syzygium oleosum TaxID=219896 RepID=UPI0011D1A225|nr:chalcone--flavanone isomerase-like [Syzygium oleosum]